MIFYNFKFKELTIITILAMSLNLVSTNAKASDVTFIGSVSTGTCNANIINSSGATSSVVDLGQAMVGSVASPVDFSIRITNGTSGGPCAIILDPTGYSSVSIDWAGSALTSIGIENSSGSVFAENAIATLKADLDTSGTQQSITIGNSIATVTDPTIIANLNTTGLKYTAQLDATSSTNTGEFRNQLVFIFSYI